MDVGTAPPLEMSLDAHASCLAFEYSSPKGSLIVVNCGMPPNARDDWRRFARSTAAHSTVTINQTSSARFAERSAFRRVLGGAPLFGGPRQIVASREDHGDGIVLRAFHDGYADRYGITHERTILLSHDGMRLDGEDAFLSADGNPLPGRGSDSFAVRFHLHPSVKATRLTDGLGVMLMTSNKEVWTFSANGMPVDLEDSVYLAGADGRRRTTQIVIHGNAQATPRVAWTLRQTATATLPSDDVGLRLRETEEPRLPL
jgi:uncharacterized heparinase superfamily protein